MNESPDSYKHAYRSGAAPLWLQVVAPLLKHARLIRRAAGFFDSSVFEINLPLWHDFIMRGGRFKLVCSPTVCAGDAEALYRGLYEANRFRAIPVHSLLLWATTRATRDRAGTRMLAWLVANDRLEVFIAVPVEGRGVYHEKFALIASESGEVAFSGSANETLSGYVRNFERLDVVRSTGATHERSGQLAMGISVLEDVVAVVMLTVILWRGRRLGAEPARARVLALPLDPGACPSPCTGSSPPTATRART